MDGKPANDASFFPPQVFQLWDPLKYEVTWLHGRWIMYRQLFGTSPERIQILNDSAATFFFYLENVLLDEVQLTLSKLGDPAKSRNKNNLTLLSLIEKVESAHISYDISLLEQKIKRLSGCDCRN